MVDSIKTNSGISNRLRIEQEENQKQLSKSSASQQDIDKFNTEMSKKQEAGSRPGKDKTSTKGDKTSTKGDGGKMDQSGKVGSKSAKGDNQAHSKRTSNKQLFTKQKDATHATKTKLVRDSDAKSSFEKSITKEAFVTQTTADQNVKKGQTEKSLQTSLAKESGQSEVKSQETIVKQNVVNQVVKKSSTDPGLQGASFKKKDNKTDSNSGVSRDDQVSNQKQFSTQMSSNVGKSSPVDRQDVIDQVNKITDYINMTVNDMGMTNSITIKFKNDVLPDTSLSINKVDDGSFELSFTSDNESSTNLIAENQSSLLESLNNNTQGARFRVKLD